MEYKDYEQLSNTVGYWSEAKRRRHLSMLREAARDAEKRGDQTTAAAARDRVDAISSMN